MGRPKLASWQTALRGYKKDSRPPAESRAPKNAYGGEWKLGQAAPHGLGLKGLAGHRQGGGV